jgi:hypothetical protein
MTVIQGNFELTEEQRRFVSLLERRPELLGFWDLQTRECDVDRLQSAMVGMSHGERILAAFFLAVWLGAEEGQHFNLMEAAAVLDASAFAVVREWVNDPFFP